MEKTGNRNVDENFHYVTPPPHAINGFVLVNYGKTDGTDAGKQDVEVFRINQGEGQKVVVKSDTRTTVLFNGIPNGEYEVRYAGFSTTGGLLWLAACSSDCPGEGHTDSIPELPGGQFVVDYSVGETASRAFGEHLQANRRISSLTYLLYDGDALVKKREIPAINTNTV